MTRAWRQACTARAGGAARPACNICQGHGTRLRPPARMLLWHGKIRGFCYRPGVRQPALSVNLPSVSSIDGSAWHNMGRGIMKKTLIAAAAGLMLVGPQSVFAGPIENACLRSDRSQATRAMCRCIDSVAQTTLTRSEQRRAASFFSDPDRAQQVRMSKTVRDNEFWGRYRAFGASAEQYCAGR